MILHREISLKELRQKLAYDPETGLLTWRYSGPSVRVGKIAGSRTGDGYIVIKINYRSYCVGPLIWFYMTGRWPEGQIDHRDHDRANNRWKNLREATHGQNQANSKSWSRHGVKGVRFIPRLKTRPWIAYIKRNKRHVHLGSFATKEKAHQAYCKAAAQLHGAFFYAG